LWKGKHVQMSDKNGIFIGLDDWGAVRLGSDSGEIRMFEGKMRLYN